MSARFDRFETVLRGLDRRGQARRLQGRAGLDFSSNDYLALASHPRLASAVRAALDAGVPVGAGSARLLRGQHKAHAALEEQAAAFFGAERSLLFGSGYAANTALLSTLPAHNDLVVHDEYVHASTHDGMRLGRARCVATPHNDADAMRDTIRAWRQAGGTGTPWIVAESLYSMDGDRAPAADLLAIAEEQDGFLILDEAHGTGVFPHQPGHPALIALHTGGKALGVGGALVAADARITAMLVNRARPFIYATAPSPLVAAALSKALLVLQDEPQRRSALHLLIAQANRHLAALGLPVTNTQILPVVLGGSERALHAAQHLQQEGFDIRAIRPPTVPNGTARLRISVTLNVDAAAIDAMALCLKDAIA